MKPLETVIYTEHKLMNPYAVELLISENFPLFSLLVAFGQSACRSPQTIFYSKKKNHAKSHNMMIVVTIKSSFRLYAGISTFFLGKIIFQLCLISKLIFITVFAFFFNSLHLFLLSHRRYFGTHDFSQGSSRKIGPLHRSD